jgi:ubiquinone/menaquinone biosynthesis C-methylase UbiE
MDKFGPEFYASYTNSVRRCDHTHVADVIRERYTPRSVLDIGCGSGYLVALWRNTGIEAWGIEISQHALDNRDSRYVIRGSFTEIPFANDSFDVVLSYGVLQYIPRTDIPTALREAKRVGRTQIHVADFNNHDSYAVTNEPDSFWRQQFALHNITSEQL